MGRNPDTTDSATRLADRVRANQSRLTGELKPRYDFIVCGSGSSGSVVARRLVENPDVTVLLLEAGSEDDTPAVNTPSRWVDNIGSERDWKFETEPNQHINHRSMPVPMGKVLGGGSSVNAMVWARGHRDDWDYFAAEAGDSRWTYRSVLDIYRRIEDWNGTPDPTFRGTGGPVFVQPAPDPNPLAPATLDAASLAGIPVYPHSNGLLMESGSGAAIGDLRVRDGKRESIFRSYTYVVMDRPNLTVLTDALVTRVVFDGVKATGVEFSHHGTLFKVRAELEVVLSLGAISTPKVLMQSGIGDQNELRRFGIPVRHHLPGVGHNLQDHVSFDCIWEYPDAQPPRNNMAEAVMFGETISGLTHPDVFAWQIEIPFTTAENADQFDVPDAGWTLHGAITHPKSRGTIHLTGRDPANVPRIEANTLVDSEDMQTAIACVEWCREIGNAAPLRPYAKREVMPGSLQGEALKNFIRNAATTFFHHCGTAKMGRDDMSVVDGELRVYGIEGLRIADGSIMPQITLANTMAPCVVIGERAGELLKTHHRV
jgi:choline dehydrogenase